MIYFTEVKKITIEDSIFQGNSATNGGSIYIEESSEISISNC